MGDDARFGRTWARRAPNPFQLWIVVACTLTGLVGVLPLSVERTGAVDRELPHALATLWYVGLLVAGGVGLVAALLPATTVTRVARALRVERVSLALLGGQLSGYGGALLAVAPRTPIGALLVALAIASVWRFHQIRGELRTLRVVVTAIVENDDRPRSPPRDAD